ncbi:MAG: ECF transporter S component [Peptococcaceae bacterium]|nr:ECF transporter S component [Peptococcaceae bacterium]
MSSKITTREIVLTALFAALACVATMVIRIPTPATSGYIHPGDAIVILCGLILGPRYGFLAAGLGSCAADLFGGYFLYVPATFLIKGTIAYLTAKVAQRLPDTTKGHLMGVIAGGALDILLVCGGYFIFEYFFYGLAAAASIPSNAIQGVSGLIIALVLSPALSAIPNVKQLMASHR